MEESDAHGLLRALVRLTVDWTSDATQSAIARSANVDIDVSDLRALYMLAMEGECRSGALATTLRQSAPTTSKQVARLRGRGLVAQRDDPADSRATLLALTPAGVTAVEALDAVTRDRIARALGDVEDPSAFASQLRRFAAALVDPARDQGGHVTPRGASTPAERPSRTRR